MNELGRSRGTSAVIAAMLSPGLAPVVLNYLSKKDLAEDAVIVGVVLLIPLLIYLSLSGSLKEIRALRGRMARFTIIIGENAKELDVIPLKSIIVQEEHEEEPNIPHSLWFLVPTNYSMKAYRFKYLAKCNFLS